MPDVPAVARPLRLIWGAVCAGGAMALVVLGGLAVSREPSMPDAAEAVFYGVAVLSMLATGAAFGLLRLMETRLLDAPSDADAGATVRTLGIASLAAAEVPTLAAGVAAFLTGDLLVLALGATLFGFAWLTWPSDGRVGYWLTLRHRNG